MSRTRITGKEDKSNDDSSHHWQKPLYIAGFTTAAGIMGALLWPLISGGWINTPPKAHEFVDLKESVGRIGEQLKGVSTDVRAHGEALAGMKSAQEGFKAAQEETNKTLRVLMMKGIPTATPTYNPQRNAVEPVRAQADER